MIRIDLENLKKFFEYRKIDVSKNKKLAVFNEVISKDEVFSVLELFQEGKFYSLIKDLKKHTHDFKNIEIIEADIDKEVIEFLQSKNMLKGKNEVLKMVGDFGEISLNELLIEFAKKY